MGFTQGRGGKNVMPESFTLTACRLFSGKAQTVNGFIRCPLMCMRSLVRKITFLVVEMGLRIPSI